MPIDVSKLKSNPATGKLIKRNGLLMRCDCCTDTTPCKVVVKARPCYLQLEEDCSRSDNYADIWVCVDATCGKEEPVGYSVPRTILIGDVCYVTDPSSVIATEKIVPTPSPVGGELDCDHACGVGVCEPKDGLPNTCPCVCHAETETDPITLDPIAWAGTFCCKAIIRPPAPELGHDNPYICADFTFEEYHEIRVDFAGTRTIGAACPYNIARGCDNNLSCVYYRREFEGRPYPSGTLEFEDGCWEGDGILPLCCRSKPLWYRDTVSRTPFAGDNCGIPSASPLCCDCPNAATGTWDYVPNGGGPLVTVSACAPVNIGTHTFSDYTYGPTYCDGCEQSQLHTQTFIYTCDGQEVIDVYETHNVFTDYCPEPETSDCFGTDPSNQCCYCEFVETSTVYTKTTWTSSEDGSEECLQCKEWLAENVYDFVESGYLDDWLYL